MLYTFRVDYRPDLKSADVLKVVDKVISAVQEHGITDDELKQAKVNFRSSFLESLESQAGFGRADLLAALALYDDDPEPHQHDPHATSTRSPQRMCSRPRRNIWCQRTARQSIDGRQRGCAMMISRAVASRRSPVVRLVSRRRVTLSALPALAQERPAVGPERPFQLAPRVERTLPNGLRVIVTRQTAIPKVSITLTVLSGYSSDPADLTGLASLTADADPGRHEDAGRSRADPARRLRHGRLAVRRRVAGLHVAVGARARRSSRRGCWISSPTWR